jgi:hypothetical protein
MSEGNGETKIPGLTAPVTLPMPQGPFLLITLNQSGSVSVNGVVNDRILSLGLLELAKEAIADHHKAAAKRILVAQPNPNLKI